jgi:hypothetical protein
MPRGRPRLPGAVGAPDGPKSPRLKRNWIAKIVYISQEQNAEINALADAQHKMISTLIRDALTAYVTNEIKRMDEFEKSKLRLKTSLLNNIRSNAVTQEEEDEIEREGLSGYSGVRVPYGYTHEDNLRTVKYPSDAVSRRSLK